MFVPFDTLPDNARVWIYQSPKAFTNEQLAVIDTKAKAFVEQWTRHGASVKGSYTVLENHFIIFGVDQDFVEVSGCSIDASVHIILELQKDFSLDLMNKLDVAFQVGDNTNVVNSTTFKSFVKEGKVTMDTLVFNNMVNTKAGLQSEWKVPAKNSWHKRYF